MKVNSVNLANCYEVIHANNPHEHFSRDVNLQAKQFSLSKGLQNNLVFFNSGIPTFFKVITVSALRYSMFFL